MVIENWILEVGWRVEILVDAVDFWDPSGVLLVGVADRTPALPNGLLVG